MKILVWNCRGARRQGVVDAARALFQRFNPDLVILMETRTSVDGAVETIDQLMFHDQIIISAEGYAGGMWLLWNSNQVTLSQQRMSNRMVHAMISFNHAAQPFMLSAVYNYPQPHLQNQVWDELLQFSSNVTANWLVVGDFNCILNLNEKKGGGKIRLKKILGFRDCIAKCGLIDLGYAGHPFTWNNRRYGKDFICERLDRALANEGWCNYFPNSKVFHLTTSISDHSPILINTNEHSNRSPRLFRYEIAWSLEASFRKIVEESWKTQNMHNTDKYFYDVYNIFRRKTIMWKKSVFGNLNQKIEDINKKLEHTLYQLETNYSENIHKEFLNLEKEHQLLLKQKELYWKQRARITWLKEGDNNTKIFHAYASNRRRRNLIQSIKLENNNWITDLESIQSVFIENFKRLYSSTQTNMFSFHTLDCPSVKESDHENLINIPNNEEILKGLKCIGPDKAPGPDGLNAHFFVTYWDSVGPHIVKIIRDFFYLKYHNPSY